MRNICGVVAEYNPFHLGHAYHLSETRRRLGEDCAIVCAISGSFVQRGDFALLDKYDRAAMAVEGGADLVVELPLTAALSSAEGFARGGAALLEALGCTHLSFGAECEDVGLFQRAAEIRRSGELQPDLAAALRRGCSYAAAMQRAMESVDPQAAALLSEPNNTLGVAYCMGSKKLRPVVIARKGAGHDSRWVKDGFASASYLRGQICEGVPGWEKWMPPRSAERLKAAMQEGRAPMRLENCDAALLSQLRRMGLEQLRLYASGGDGFAERLVQAIRKGNTFTEVCDLAQTRRFPLARIRRTLLRVWLELPEGLPTEPLYIRVLAIGRRGAEILRAAHGALPVIVKPVSERRLPEALQPALRRDVLADALYALAAPVSGQRSAQARWKKTPFLLRP